MNRWIIKVKQIKSINKQILLSGNMKHSTLYCSRNGSSASDPFRCQSGSLPWANGIAKFPHQAMHWWTDLPQLEVRALWWSELSDGSGVNHRTLCQVSQLLFKFRCCTDGASAAVAEWDPSGCLKKVKRDEFPIWILVVVGSYLIWIMSSKPQFPQVGPISSLQLGDWPPTFRTTWQDRVILFIGCIEHHRTIVHSTCNFWVVKTRTHETSKETTPVLFIAVWCFNDLRKLLGDGDSGQSPGAQKARPSTVTAFDLTIFDHHFWCLDWVWCLALNRTALRSRWLTVAIRERPETDFNELMQVLFFFSVFTIILEVFLSFFHGFFSDFFETMPPAAKLEQIMVWLPSLNCIKKNKLQHDQR